ncbi:MAG: carboxypeptidase-like regulatory domain-containing protein, partial [Bacteroidales bacterium]
MKKLTLMIAVLVLAGFSALFAQTSVITGTVSVSEDGELETVPGVAVTVKGTTIGTATGPDGKYTLEVPESATHLVFQFVGMKTLEEPINDRTTIDVVMESDLVGIDEVVVTAIGIERKTREIGYSMSRINAEDLTQARST